MAAGARGTRAWSRDGRRGAGSAVTGPTAGQAARMVSTVHAPTQTRSPSRRRTREPAAISLPLTCVPLADPGSKTVQPPSFSAIRTACRWEKPGSTRAPEGAPRVGGRAGQVDLRVQPAGHAAAADAHLRSLEPEPPLRAVCGE